MNAAPALSPRKRYIPRPVVAANDGTPSAPPPTHHGDRRFRVRSIPDWRHWRDPLPSVAEARAFAVYVRRSLRETGVMLPCSAEDTLRIVSLVEAIYADHDRCTAERIELRARRGE